MPGLFWLVLWWDLSIDWATNAQYAFGWCVPVAAISLFMQRWRFRPEPDLPDRRARLLVLTAVVALVLLHFPLRFLGEANAEWRMLYWVRELQCILLSLACLVRAGGWKWARYFAFPILFTASAVPWPGDFETFVVQWLTRFGTSVTVEGLLWIGVPAVQLGNVIQIGNGVVGINTACSGIRSLQVCLMVALLAGEFWNLRPRQRCWVVAGGVCAAFFFNVLRMLALTWVEAISGSGAFRCWHDPLGWIEMGICITVVFLFAGWIKDHTPPHDKTVCGPDSGCNSPVFPRPVPLWLGCLAMTVWLLAEFGTEQWYAAHDHGKGGTQQWKVIAPDRADPDFSGWIKVDIPEESRALLRTNDGFALQGKESGGLTWHITCLQWPAARTSVTAAAAHHPDVCLPAAGYQFIRENPIVEITVRNISLRLHHYLFKGAQFPTHVFYMHGGPGESPDETPGGGGSLFARRIRAAIAGRRDLGQSVLQFSLSGAASDEVAVESLKKVVEKLVHRADDVPDRLP